MLTRDTRVPEKWTPKVITLPLHGLCISRDAERICARELPTPTTAFFVCLCCLNWNGCLEFLPPNCSPVFAHNGILVAIYGLCFIVRTLFWFFTCLWYCQPLVRRRLWDQFYSGFVNLFQMWIWSLNPNLIKSVANCRTAPKMEMIGELIN